MVKVKNMDIEEAVRLYEELKERKEVVHLYNSRLMEEMDNKARLNYAVRKATEATEKRVRKETEKATLDQVIRKLLSEKVSKDIILKVTGISEEKLNSFILDNNT